MLGGEVLKSVSSELVHGLAKAKVWRYRTD